MYNDWRVYNICLRHHSISLSFPHPFLGHLLWWRHSISLFLSPLSLDIWYDVISPLSSHPFPEHLLFVMYCFSQLKIFLKQKKRFYNLFQITKTLCKDICERSTFGRYIYELFQYVEKHSIHYIKKKKKRKFKLIKHCEYS